MGIIVNKTENAVTVITQENSITVSSPGPQGARGLGVRIQYSIDGVTDWLDEPTSGVRYFRISTDEGTTWGDAVWFGATSDAEAARDKAVQWAENPEDVEVEPGKYSALHHKEKALDAQARAEAAKTAAETARTGAETAEANALASENKAYKWAQENEDVEVAPGEYSAYHWAKKAENYAPLIEDQIVDGVTDKSPSQNAVYDALAGKADTTYVNSALAGKADTTYVNSALATKIGSVSEDTTPELGGELDAGEHTIGFTERSNTSSAGAVTIDWTKSNHQFITLTENTTFTFTNPTNPCNLTLRIKQDAVGGWTVTMPTLKTPSGIGVSFSTAANAEDLMMLYFDGVNYIATVLQDVK